MSSEGWPGGGTPFNLLNITWLEVCGAGRRADAPTGDRVEDVNRDFINRNKTHKLGSGDAISRGRDDAGLCRDVNVWLNQTESELDDHLSILIPETPRLPKIYFRPLGNTTPSVALVSKVAQRGTTSMTALIHGSGFFLLPHLSAQIKWWDPPAWINGCISSRNLSIFTQSSPQRDS